MSSTTHKIRTRLLAALLVLAMTLTCAAVPANAAAKKKIKLSKTKITLQVKKSKTLKITGTTKKVKWYVTGKNKKLVTIKTKGKKRHTAVIKAGKKAGTCYVNAKIGKKVLKCKVTVKKKKTPTKPDQPVNPDPTEDTFEAKPISDSSVNLTANYTAGNVETVVLDEAFIKAAADTSIRLLQETLKAEVNPKNTLISPDSIFTALAMVENGAAGDTLAQMEQALGGIDIESYNKYMSTLNNRLIQSKQISYHIADSIWYSRGFITPLQEFLQKNVDYYSAEIYEAPFSNETLEDINNWVYNNTKGMIPSILDEIRETDRMVLINAIAFEGKWQDIYEDYAIDGNGTFTPEGKEAQTVTMLKGCETTYVSVAGADGFVKPYEGGELAFMALLPQEGTSVDEYVQSLTGEDFVKGYQERMVPSEEMDVIVDTRLPEFSYDYDVTLNGVLFNMGMRDAFDEFAADFSKLAVEPMMIDRVLHKTHIELDRNGTKAAAVTAVTVKDASCMPHENVFRKKVYLDRPFAYAIIDTRSGLPLFIGVLRSVK